MSVFDDFGITAKRGRKEAALEASSQMSQILGFGLQIEKSESATNQGIGTKFRSESVTRRADPSLSPNRTEKLGREAAALKDMNEVYSAQLQKTVRGFNFAQRPVVAGAGRVALRPLYDSVARAEGKVDPRTRSAFNWGLRLPPSILPRAIKPIGGAADVRVYTGACATEGGSAAAARFGSHSIALFAGKARDAPNESPAATGEVFGIELFPIVVAKAA